MRKLRKTQPENQEEIARLVMALRSLPPRIADVLTAAQIVRGFNVKLHPATVGQIVRDYKREQGMKAETEKGINPENIGAQVVLEKLARIVTKTSAHLGDDERIGSEEANQMVYRELKQYDPSLITRNAKRRLPKS